MRAVGGVSADQRPARQVTRQLGYRPAQPRLAAVRDSAAAIGLVPGVLHPFPLAADVISNPALTRHPDQIGPCSPAWTPRPRSE
jgi:hypothetical protein